MELIIKQLTDEDMLNDYWNVHLKEVISAKINIIIYKNIISKKGEKEIVGEKQVVVGQTKEGGPMLSKMNIKVGDALLAEKARLEKQQVILDAINELRKK